MQSYQSISAARAIAATMIRQYIFKVIIVVLIVLGLLFFLFLYLLLRVDLLWIIGLIFVIPLICIIGLGGFFTHLIIQRILPPRLDKKERQQINHFINEFSIKYMALSSIKRTPLGLATYIMWRYIRGGEKSIKETIIAPAKDVDRLRLQFQEIAKLF